MRLGAALRQAQDRLEREGIPDPWLEAQVLFSEVLGPTRTQLLAQPERALAPGEIQGLDQLLHRRLLREPTAYILGRREFYGRDFSVDPRVLIPRPETELLVEGALGRVRELPEEPLLAEVGTGSGAIAITLALEIPQARVYALDISTAALEVARINCRRYGVEGRVELLQGDLLSPLPQPVHMVIANLPYIPQATRLPPEVSHEPSLALCGGPDGLALFRAFLAQARPWLLPGGCILLEIGVGQAEAVMELVAGYFPQAQRRLLPDLAGTPRVVEIDLN